MRQCKGVGLLLFLALVLGVFSVGHAGAEARPTEKVAPSPEVNPNAVIWRTPEPPKEAQAGDVWVNPKDEMELVYVAAGEFAMGSPEGEGDPDEHPLHSFHLNGFWIDKTEVTVARYRRFCQATGRQMPDAPQWSWEDDHPVVNVTWHDAAAYAAWAGKRLPTEVEWEKAARGTDGREYPWGNAWDSSKCANSSNSTTTKPVGSYPAGASPYGVLDMAGNAMEWCADWFDKEAYQRHLKGDLSPPASGVSRALRGGSWYSGYPVVLRCADRYRLDPDCRDHYFGFRGVQGSELIGTDSSVPPAARPDSGLSASEKILQVLRAASLSSECTARGCLNNKTGEFDLVRLEVKGERAGKVVDALRAVGEGAMVEPLFDRLGYQLPRYFSTAQLPAISRVTVTFTKNAVFRDLVVDVQTQLLPEDAPLLQHLASLLGTKEVAKTLPTARLGIAEAGPVWFPPKGFLKAMPSRKWQKQYADGISRISELAQLDVPYQLGFHEGIGGFDALRLIVHQSFLARKGKRQPSVAAILSSADAQNPYRRLLLCMDFSLPAGDLLNVTPSSPWTIFPDKELGETDYDDLPRPPSETRLSWGELSLGSDGKLVLPLRFWDVAVTPLFQGDTVCLGLGAEHHAYDRSLVYSGETIPHLWIDFRQTLLYAERVRLDINRFPLSMTFTILGSVYTGDPMDSGVLVRAPDWMVVGGFVRFEKFGFH